MPTLLLAAAAMATIVAAQADPFAGRWAAAEADRGVVVTLQVEDSSTLIIPGSGPDGRTEALTLALRNVRKSRNAMTFRVDLPGDNGNVDFEFRVSGAGDVGTLRAIAVDGEPPDEDTPTWTLRRSRTR